MTKRWLLSYRPFVAQKDEERFVAFINNWKLIESWSHPYVGLFVLHSERNVTELGKAVREYFADKTSFILVDMTSQSFDARLPMTTWDWLREKGLEVEVRPVSD